MKHTPTVEDSENTGLTGKIYHTAEEHSFEPSEETALTSHGVCPHCGTDVYSINARRLAEYWILSGAAVFALLHLGLPDIAVMTVAMGVFVTTWLSDFTDTAHRVLSRVGL
jgi:uncharacterized paraquat-inducible protein A